MIRSVCLMLSSMHMAMTSNQRRRSSSAFRTKMRAGSSDSSTTSRATGRCVEAKAQTGNRWADQRRAVPRSDYGWKKLHRLYVRLDGERRRFVLLDGETKSADAALPATVYRRVGRFGNDYMATRRISPPR